MLIFLHCVLSKEFSNCSPKDALLHWLHLLTFWMRLQIAWDDAKSYFSGTCFSECAFTFPRKWKSFVPFLQKYGDCGRSITNVMNSWRLATLSGNLGRLVIYPTPLDFHRDIWWCFNLKVVSIHFEHFIIDYLSFISSQGNLY